MRRQRRWHGLALSLGLTLTMSCSQIVQYTDEIGDADSGRSALVTTPANLGAFAGFVFGIPADIAALPLTFVVYRIQHSQNRLTADAVSTMLFPSFVLWRTGALLGTPFDMLEFVAWRAWRPPTTPSDDEQAEIEYEFDQDTLQSYPVEPLYPVDTENSAANPTPDALPG